MMLTLLPWFRTFLMIDSITLHQVSVEVHKKEVFWIHIPCVDGVGSCTYDDVCTMVDPSQCPEAFKKHHIPCECPIKAVRLNFGIANIFETIPIMACHVR